MDPSEEQIEELVARAVEGDGEAVGALYRCYEESLIAAAHRARGNTLRGLMESVDLVQSTWKDVLDDLPRFEPRGPGSFGAWLRTCLDNKIRAKGRYFGAQKRDAHLETPLQEGARTGAGALPPAAGPTPSRIAREDEELARLMAVLAAFPEAERLALILRLRDELAYEDIAARIGRSSEATKKLCVRAMPKLIGRLLAAGFEAPGGE